MSPPKNNSIQIPIEQLKNVLDADLLKVFAQPQDQYTCNNLNNKEIAIAFLEGFK